MTQEIIDFLKENEYGTLALCMDNKPYSLPINFVEHEREIFFHGAKKGKKIDCMRSNTYASFSVTQDYSLLPSYFSTDKGNACPATHLYKSCIINGQMKLIENYEQKAQALEALMQKLQKEGKYIPLNHEMYKKAINATAIFKLVPEDSNLKVKLGQGFNEQRFQRVKTHLLERGTKKDLETLRLIEEQRA